MKMLGKKHKPFCGDCCSEYRKGSGDKNKKIPKRIEKRREKRFWKKEL